MAPSAPRLFARTCPVATTHNVPLSPCNGRCNNARTPVHLGACIGTIDFPRPLVAPVAWEYLVFFRDLPLSHSLTPQNAPLSFAAPEMATFRGAVIGYAGHEVASHKTAHFPRPVLPRSPSPFPSHAPSFSTLSLCALFSVL
ncbi:unnamed protein product [Penicillium salamii]|nr:unnamed protein product [Penicillium salamii]